MVSFKFLCKGDWFAFGQVATYTIFCLPGLTLFKVFNREFCLVCYILSVTAMFESSASFINEVLSLLSVSWSFMKLFYKCWLLNELWTMPLFINFNSHAAPWQTTRYFLLLKKATHQSTWRRLKQGHFISFSVRLRKFHVIKRFGNIHTEYPNSYSVKIIMSTKNEAVLHCQQGVSTILSCAICALCVWQVRDNVVYGEFLINCSLNDSSNYWSYIYSSKLWTMYGHFYFRQSLSVGFSEGGKSLNSVVNYSI